MATSKVCWIWGITRSLHSLRSSSFQPLAVSCSWVVVASGQFISLNATVLQEFALLRAGKEPTSEVWANELPTGAVPLGADAGALGLVRR